MEKSVKDINYSWKWKIKEIKIHVIINENIFKNYIVLENN